MKDFIITDEQINEAFNGTNFGPVETVEQKRREVVQAALKRVCDYGTGHTISCILQELGITKTIHGKPTKAARRWMYDQCKLMSALP